MTAMRLQEAASESSVRTAMTNVERSVRRFSRNDSQDIVQEAMTRAVCSGVGCDAEPWLRTVARRIAIDRSRRTHELCGGGTDEMDLLARNNGCTPEDVVVSNEGIGLVGKAMASMPRRYRDALLTYAEDQQAESVSKRFGISAAATWTLLSRARSRLRQELDRVGYAFGSVAVPLHRFATEAGAAAAVVAITVGTTFGAAHVGAVAKPPAAPAPTVEIGDPAVAPPVAPPTATSSNKPAASLPVAIPVEVAPPGVPDHATLAEKTCRVMHEAPPAVRTLTDRTRSLLQPVTSKLPEPVQKLTCVDR